jgi:hypothetical protein
MEGFVNDQPLNDPVYGSAIGTPNFAQPTGPPNFAQPTGTPNFAQPMGTPSFAQPIGTPNFAQPIGAPSSAQPIGASDAQSLQSNNPGWLVGGGPGRTRDNSQRALRQQKREAEWDARKRESEAHWLALQQRVMRPLPKSRQAGAPVAAHPRWSNTNVCDHCGGDRFACDCRSGWAPKGHWTSKYDWQSEGGRDPQWGGSGGQNPAEGDSVAQTQGDRYPDYT